jgi:hypothetical protein
MISPKNLLTGLDGAIGSCIDAEKNRLLFVEFSGKLSSYDLTPKGAYVLFSSTDTTWRGTYIIDFETGSQRTGAGGDIWWQQHTDTERSMTPQNGAQLAYLGHINYNTLTYAQLAALNYSSNPINGSNNSGNLLTTGAVFAVRTNQGNYTKVQILEYGYNIRVKWRTYKLDNPYKVLGSEYQQPEDIALSADGLHAYMTERTGNLMKVKLATPSRSLATVVSGGMTAPHQIWLDEEQGTAYTVEFAPSGRLMRIDLHNGAQTVIASGLNNAIGLVLTQSRQYAYITEQASSGGRLIRINLAGGVVETIRSGLVNPFFLTWTDAGESGLLITERDPANRISRLSLAGPEPSLQVIANVDPQPSSVVIASPYKLIACSRTVLSELKLDEAVYSPTGPIFLGIGHVPVNRITDDGYADTTADTEYFFQIKDAPFGGSLPLMINHTRAYAENARYYTVEVDGNLQSQPFTDYLWNTTQGKFIAEEKVPSLGYYPVRLPNTLWYNHWLGSLLPTAGLPNGEHTITIKLFRSKSPAALLSQVSKAVRIDNSRPLASIDEIIHHHAIKGPTVVGTCGIVTEDSDRFSFRITASDAEGHLRDWSLVASWGDNKHAPIASMSYAPNSSKEWVGLNNVVVPESPWVATVAGDSTSRRCAHTFYLNVWDRTIDGYRNLHGSEYRKSITLLLEAS